ncbi:sensor domain-containing diguanylate cyclase [Vibrio kasasachensis]|uniref:sensor domain-containing diguanylate cyclase n=1 Tax=Vibrio kasasachensis TaxID=2910248 RepID=UPI003D0D30EA
MSHAAIKKIKAIMSQLPLTQGIEGVAQTKQKINHVCREFNYQLPTHFTLILEAVKCNRNNNRRKAVDAFEEALSLCRDEDIAERLQIKTLLGSIYADYDELHKAYALYSDVLEHAYRLDANYLSFAYTNISDFYLCLGQFDKAYQIAAYGAQYGEKIGHHSNHAICLLNMGYALGYKHSEHKQAILHCKRALELGHANRATRVKAIAHGYIAQVMARNANIYSSTDINHHFEQADLFFTGIFDNHNRTECRVHHIAYISEFGNQRQALDQALKLYEEINPEDNYGFFALLCDCLCNLLDNDNNSALLCKVQSNYIKVTQQHLRRLQDKEFDNLLSQIEKATQNHELLVLDKMQQHIAAVTDVGQSIATSENIADNLEMIFEKICSIFPTNEFGIALYHEDIDTLDYCYFYDSNGPVDNFTVNCTTQYSVGSYVIKNKRTVHLNRINDEAMNMFVPIDERNTKTCAQFRNDTPVQSIIITPILMQNKVLGVLSIQHHLSDQYLQYHCNLFEQLASFIAVALENHIQRNRLESAYKKLDTLSKTDPLTGLYNRYQLDNIAPELIARMTELHTNLSIAVIDVDYYKGYNDFHGHHQGDIALELIANEMKKVFASNNDYLFRYGGDEFLLLSSNSSTQKLTAKLEQLQQAVRGLALVNPLSTCSEYVTLSIGAATCCHTQHNEGDFLSLFNLADQELYKIKKAGRNRLSIANQCLTKEPT